MLKLQLQVLLDIPERFCTLPEQGLLLGVQVHFHNVCDAISSQDTRNTEKDFLLDPVQALKHKLMSLSGFLCHHARKLQTRNVQEPNSIKPSYAEGRVVLGRTQSRLCPGPHGQPVTRRMCQGS